MSLPAVAVATVLGELPRDALRLLGIVLAATLVPALLAVVAVTTLLAALLSAVTGVGPTFGAGAAPGAPPPIPSEQLAVMVEVGAQTGVPWSLLAAIASVESAFGANMATSSAGAIGYGQFLPASWAAYGAGGDPYGYRDALPAMARYLLDHGVNGDAARAVYAYNHSWEYVLLVLGRATYYATAVVPPSPSPPLSSAVARLRTPSPRSS